MGEWSVHQLFREAKPILGVDGAKSLQAYASGIRKNGFPVIFTLNHLAKIVGINYQLLHLSINRKRESSNYRIFTISKRSGGKRYIHAVTEDLRTTQMFINSEILQKTTPHPSSYAFHPSGGVLECAKAHCGARWLFQYDLSNFFYHISETKVFEIFLKMGYRRLLAFELARICTTTRMPKHLHSHLKWLTKERQEEFKFYRGKKVGILPQGAPTSPMLANLAAFELDESLSAVAQQYGLTYTRYADDLTFSCGDDKLDSISIKKIHRAIVSSIVKNGFLVNESKHRIARPGSKKIVLGLLVDGDKPRISRETYKRIDRLLYAVEKFGYEAVATHENLDSPIGLYNHIQGLLGFVKSTDTERWAEFKRKFDAIESPWAL